MPLYYFDVYDNDRLTTDENGIELANLYEAREQAQKALWDIIRDLAREDDERDITVIVKCHEKRTRFRSTISVRAEWVEPPDYPQTR